MAVAAEEPEEDRGFLAKGPAEGDGFSLVGEERRSWRRGRVQGLCRGWPEEERKRSKSRKMGGSAEEDDRWNNKGEWGAVSSLVFCQYQRGIRGFPLAGCGTPCTLR